MKNILIVIMLLFSTYSFAQEFRVTGARWDSAGAGLYRLQTGAFRNTENAVRLFNSLRNSGLTPIYESRGGLRIVTLPGIDARHVSAALYLLRNAGVGEVFIRTEDASSRYRIQVGAFRDTANAERAFNTLRSAGLNPVFENFRDYRRVMLDDINVRFMPSLLNIIYNIGFYEVWVSAPVVSNLTITVIGNAAVSEIGQSFNPGPLAIVQTVPFFSPADAVLEYQANAPVVFFFNDNLYLGSLKGNIIVTADGRPVHGTVVINEAANGYAVLTFTPREQLPPGQQISVVMSRELQDGGGNRMQRDFHLSFVTTPGAQTAFTPDNFGFETGADTTGVVFNGDGAILRARGPLVPFEGYYLAAISTGSRLLSAGTAMGGTMSQIILGPIMEPFSSLAFHFNFISAEFNEFVGSEFDDTATITVSGPQGSRSEIITTVNTVGFNNTPFVGFPGMPDMGSSAGHTGWQVFRMDNLNVGTPAFITFTITDVADDIYSSILAVDAIVLE